MFTHYLWKPRFDDLQFWDPELGAKWLGKLLRFLFTSKSSKSSTHYLADTNRFDVSSKGPSSGVSVHSH